MTAQHLTWDIGACVKQLTTSWDQHFLLAYEEQCLFAAPAVHTIY